MKRHLPRIEQLLPTGGTQARVPGRDDVRAGRLRRRGSGHAAVSATIPGV
ncbi:hypothetical protein [Streptomyces sp. NPDC092903]